MKRLLELRRFLLACCLAFSLTLFPTAGFADFGNYAGNSDYGGGGSSYDGGSSYSYDDDDDDYGSSYSGDSDSSDGGPGSYIMAAIIAVIIIIIVVAKDSAPSRKKSRKQGETPDYIKNSTYKDTVGKKKSEKEKSMTTYLQVDPNFDESAFTEQAANLYVKMQNAWTDKNIEPLRPYFTGAFFAQMERQLEQMVRDHQTNYVERIAVLDVSAEGWYQEQGYDHITLIIQTRIVDYTLDDETGELVSGSKTAEKFMTYEWDMSRLSGTITQEQAELDSADCPNCGASLDINTTAECPYCGSVVTVRHDMWALCSIKGLAQRTVK